VLSVREQKGRCEMLVGNGRGHVQCTQHEEPSPSHYLHLIKQSNVNPAIHRNK
jgi:hypothetical protein